MMLANIGELYGRFQVEKNWNVELRLPTLMCSFYKTAFLITVYEELGQPGAVS